MCRYDHYAHPLDQLQQMREGAPEPVDAHDNQRAARKDALQHRRTRLLPELCSSWISAKPAARRAWRWGRGDDPQSRWRNSQSGASKRAVCSFIFHHQSTDCKRMQGRALRRCSSNSPWFSCPECNQENARCTSRVHAAWMLTCMRVKLLGSLQYTNILRI